MREMLDDALSGCDADYVEIRLEETDSTRIAYHGSDIDGISQMSGRGGNVRAAFKGGWGFVSFNQIGDLKRKVEMAVERARLVGTETTTLANVTPQVESVTVDLSDDPSFIALGEKKEQMEHYNEIVLSVNGIQSSEIVYGDFRRRVQLATTDGAYVDKSEAHVICRVSAQARDGGNIQQAGFSIGSAGDYGLVRDLDHNVLEAAERAVAQLRAPSLPGGERTVILDPVLAGVFAHEAFGHLSEADHVYENEKLKEIMVLGRRFGAPHLNITDGAALPGMRGSYAFDDEGTPSGKTNLIKDGVLVGRLHSRETAGKMGESPTGNARSIGFNFPPIVRMTNTFIEPQNAKFEDLLEGVDQGVYVKNWYGGMTTMEMFTFSAGEAYMIRNGRIQEMIKPVMLSGNLFTTLENIDAIGDDLGMNQGGGCGKAGQSPLPVATGSPHIRIRDCLVSGA